MMSTLRKNAFGSVLGLLALLACSKPQEPVEAPVTEEPIAAKSQNALPDTTLFVVLTSERNTNYAFGHSKTASLSTEEVLAVERLLKAGVIAYNLSQVKHYRKVVEENPKLYISKKSFFIHLPDYKRQLVAGINDKGEKEVWVNCFCGYQYDWRKSIKGIKDGGNCYFNVKVNLAKQNWYDMEVNGES